MFRKPIYQETIFTDGVDTYFHFPIEKVIGGTTQDYRTFLKEAGYMDLEAGNGLLVARRLLHLDSTIRDAAKAQNIPLNGNDGDYVTNINQPNARNLAACLDGNLLTTGLMYHVFIPFIKDLASQGNAEAQATLDEMINTKAEWLEDLIVNKNTVKIGNKNKQLMLLQNDVRFDRADMNEFGYPGNVKQNGEFYYWFPRDNERAAIRGRSSDLGLDLDWGPSVEGDRLGVRVAKNFI